MFRRQDSVLKNAEITASTRSPHLIGSADPLALTPVVADIATGSITSLAIVIYAAVLDASSRTAVLSSCNVYLLFIHSLLNTTGRVSYPQLHPITLTSDHHFSRPRRRLQGNYCDTDYGGTVCFLLIFIITVDALVSTLVR